jgi:hypothetical protein
VTPPDDLIRESLRDLIPAYSGPPDPYPRVGATIVRRRRVHRRLVAASAMAAVVAVAVGVPALLRGVAPGRPGAVPAAGAPSTGAGGPAVPMPAGELVTSGTLGGATWSVYEGPMSTDARRCLRADDAVFAGAAVCFDDWHPGEPPGWRQMTALHTGVTATAYFGVAPRTADLVKVVLSDGKTYPARAVRVAGEPAATFFAVVAPRPGLVLVALHAYSSTGAELSGRPAPPRTSGCDPTIASC